MLNGWCLGCWKTPSLGVQTEDAGMKFYLSDGNKTLYEIPLYWFVHEQQITVKIPSRQTSPYPTKRQNRKISSSWNFVPSKKGTPHRHILFPRRVSKICLTKVCLHSLIPWPPQKHKGPNFHGGFFFVQKVLLPLAKVTYPNGELVELTYPPTLDGWKMMFPF